MPFAAAVSLLFAQPALAEGQVRAGVLKFGTVKWELSLIKRRGLDAKHGFELVVADFAGGEASRIALRSGDVDVAVGDFFNVAVLRRDGADIVFAPYSAAVGAVMVAGDSPLASLGDLRGKRIGVAGGPVDKGWLLIRALSKRDFGFDPAEEAEEVFYGAPPLIAKKLEQGELDAALNFWHWCARLEAKGYRRMISFEDAARELGVERRIPQLGYLFNREKLQPELADAFLAASREAKQIMLRDDGAWDELREANIIKPKSDAEFAAYRKRFREGIPRGFDDGDIAAAAKLYGILSGIGGAKLTGGAAAFDKSIIYAGAKY